MKAVLGCRLSKTKRDRERTPKLNCSREANSFGGVQTALGCEKNTP
jgi:hypothetical protein